MLLEFTSKGIYCSQLDWYVDPWVPVDKAIITHAHSDHAKWGCNHYLSHELSEPVLRLRLGQDIRLETLSYGQTIIKNGVKISLHPAGHIIGSSQVRLEYQGEVWVVSGDYKVEYDGLSTAFEPVACHSFITECTFGLPVFKWEQQSQILAEVNEWWKTNSENDITSVLLGYPLGKIQRLLFHLNPEIGKIYAHGSVFNTTNVLRSSEIRFPEITRVTNEIDKKHYRKAMILAPPSAIQSPWIKKFKPFSAGLASGWMTLRGAKRRRPVDRGFILSDHADWDGLLGAIEATGAERVFATHGYKSIFARHLRELGYDAHEADTLWEGEVAEESGGEDTEEAKSKTLKDNEKEVGQ